MMTTLEQQLQGCIRSIDQVKDLLHLTNEEADILRDVSERYPICITPYYLSLVDPDDPDDPIRKMCLPTALEYQPGGVEDTSGESSNTVLKGLQHKYRQTVIILSTNQCAMYCRHCFRKRMVGYSAGEIANELPDIVNYVSSHPEISNVLISGGDAFMNTNATIQKYLEAFISVPNVEYIRFGTRIPVVLPRRISEDAELLDILRRYCTRKQIIIVTQFNHPREITPDACNAIRLMMSCGCIIRNQTVLLRGINDTPETLAKLQNTLIKVGVVPYYIFQCRPAAGVMNQFQVPLLQGYRIVDAARAFMSGQSKSARYCMSHVTGKIEIIGETADHTMLFKYHQNKYSKDAARIFTAHVDDDQCWLPEEIPE